MPQPRVFGWIQEDHHSRIRHPGPHGFEHRAIGGAVGAGIAVSRFDIRIAAQCPEVIALVSIDGPLVAHPAPCLVGRVVKSDVEWIPVHLAHAVLPAIDGAPSRYVKRRPSDTSMLLSASSRDRLPSAQARISAPRMASVAVSNPFAVWPSIPTMASR